MKFVIYPFVNHQSFVKMNLKRNFSRCMKKYKSLVSLGLLSFMLFHCAPPAPNSEAEADPTSPIVIEQTENTIKIDLVAMDRQNGFPTGQNITIDKDIVFNAQKSYQAYPFHDIILPYMKELGLNDASEGTITFHCSDGYAPKQAVSEVFSAKPFLAYQDQSMINAGQAWPDSVNQKFKPYYLVWTNTENATGKLNWPYGLVGITISKVDTSYNPITPKDASVLAGFQLFKAHCIKCHAINKIGGQVGPEFNYPKNITTYWEVEDMWAFVQNPQSYRYNAKMAAIPYLKRTEFDEIITYLKYMEDIKLDE